MKPGSQPAISKQDVHHAFDRFYHTDVARTREDGSESSSAGLAKALVEAHGDTRSGPRTLRPAERVLISRFRLCDTLRERVSSGRLLPWVGDSDSYLL